MIFVGGGNTKSMLALWREWGLDVILRKAWEKGVVLSGMSAGQICWFEQGLTDSIPRPVTALKCLGYLPNSCTPHYNSEPDRRPRFHQRIGSGEMMAGYATDNGAAPLRRPHAAAHDNRLSRPPAPSGSRRPTAR